MRIATFVLGLPGAGKSTYTRSARADLIVSFDDIRKTLTGTAYDPFAEAAVLEKAVSLMAAHTGDHIIIDEAFTTPCPVGFAVTAAKAYGYYPRALVIDTHPAVCLRRRLLSGFPADVWLRKNEEWTMNRDLILDLFPFVARVRDETV